MRKKYHILNGDALKDLFPKSIKGEIIVNRECLIEGNIEGKNLNQLFLNRAKFINQTYGNKEQDYYNKVVSEFIKIQKLENSDINLWFEDDLFCQVNFWFTVKLLNKKNSNNRLYLIRPKLHTQFGFGGLGNSELKSVYEERIIITEIDKISKLWDAYKKDETDKLYEIALDLKSKYPFIIQVVNAHLERIPKGTNLGRPMNSLIAIMNELKTEEFDAIFNEFIKRENIYGFGDSQIKRLYNKIKSQSKK